MYEGASLYLLSSIEHKSQFFMFKDVNECNAGLCGTNSDCTNLLGSYSCQCNAGFVSPANSQTDCIGKTIEIICSYCFSVF